MATYYKGTLSLNSELNEGILRLGSFSSCIDIFNWDNNFDEYCLNYYVNIHITKVMYRNILC